jgi:hypothetical protein
MTRKNNHKRFLYFLLLAAIAACMPGRQLLTSGVKPDEITGAGTYTMFLYGCHYPADVKNAVFLIKTGEKRSFRIFDLDTSYTTEKDVPAARAIAEADRFIRCTSYRVTGTGLRRIPDGNGGVLGYEVRPLYFPLEFGSPDILLISYTLKDGTVTAYIKLQPDVEKALENSGSRESDSSHH